MKFKLYSGFEQLPDSSDKLVLKAEQRSIFFSRPWFENLVINGLSDDEHLVLACVESGDEVLAILPMLKHTGSTWQSLKHRYTTHYSILLGDDHKNEVLECLVTGLEKSQVYALLLEPVASDENDMVALQKGFRSAGYQCELIFRHYNWIYRTRIESYEDFMAERPAKLRNTIIRKSRKLDREHGFRVNIYTDNNMARALDDYFNVYKLSWKAHEQFEKLVRGMVERFNQRGFTRIGVLYVEDKPVAAQLWFVAHGKASIFRLAYDEHWKKYSPGSILTAKMMQYVIETDQVREIDFLTGNDTYKRDWMSERRERFALSCVKKQKPKNRVYSFFSRVGNR